MKKKESTSRLLRAYYLLTKPGIILGNLITATAGFLLAADGHIPFGLLLATLAGTSLIIASACVFNNIIDRDIDKLMVRTRKRALVDGTIAKQNALIYAAILGALGFGVLGLFTNYLTILIGLAGMFFYVVVYGVAKRRTVHGTLIGTISGGLPPVAGYAAVTNNIDTGAILLFLILVFWQMAHFYAIALFRLQDYTAADIPVLPAVRGIAATRIQIFAYIIAFLAACTALSIAGYSGYIFLLIMCGLTIAWLRLGLKKFTSSSSAAWGRSMFGFSLLVITVWSVVVSAEAILP